MAEEIERLVKKSAFTDNIEFEGGKLTVFGIAIGDKSELRDKTVGESAYLNPNLSANLFCFSTVSGLTPITSYP